MVDNRTDALIGFNEPQGARAEFGIAEPDGRLRTRTIANMIAQELRARILTGEIPTGARLQQNHVATQFGVSSTPVREAFAELRRQGLLAKSEHLGVRVFRPTLSDVIEASEVLEFLEGTAIAGSALLLTDADLAEASSLLEAHSRVPANQWRRRLDLDTAFHLSLLVRCPNKKFKDLAESAHRDTVVHKLVLSSVEGEELMGVIYEQHKAIFTACVARDAEAACARTIEHIRWGLKVSQDIVGRASRISRWAPTEMA